MTDSWIFALICCLLSAPAASFAQDIPLFHVAVPGSQPPVQPAPAQPRPAQTGLLSKVPELDQEGGLHLTKHVSLEFGDIKAGSAIALGPALSTTFADGGFAQVKAEYSTREFAVLQALYHTRPLAGGRVSITSRVRWQDAPTLALFELGAAAPLKFAQYGERKIDVSARAVARLARHVRVGGGLGFERYRLTAGSLDLSEDESLPRVPDVPGLGSRVSYLHAMVSGAYDTRPSVDYNRRGHLFETALHAYRAGDGPYSCARVDLTGEQLIATAGDRGIVDLTARGWLSHAADDQVVPFFLMPTLGGGQYLEGFRLYRFRDRDAMLLRGEYRWAVHENVDLAAIYEAGAVAASAADLGHHALERSVGAGVRLHSDTATLVALDLAHGREGFGVSVSFTGGHGNR